MLRFGIFVLLWNLEVKEGSMTRRKLERTFGLIHYFIVEGGILILTALGIWHLISR
jgi:hypothetical protein